MSKNGVEKGSNATTNGSANGASTTAIEAKGASVMASVGATGAGMNDFVRQAIREKAERELAGLQQRLDAVGGVERARDALHRVATDVTAAAGAYAGMTTTDTAVASKMKKLKKLVEEAHALATDLGDVLGVGREREALEAQRREIGKALEAAGIDPSAVGGAIGSA
jgi:hypothetical protein